MKNFRIEAMILAIGLLLLGWGIRQGLESYAESSRVVSVRGLAEREVKADHVIWPIVYKTTGNDLNAIYNHLNTVSTELCDFLKKGYLTSADITVGAPKLTDLWSERYASDNVRQRDRYNATLIVTVSTSKVNEVIGLRKQAGELLKLGIALTEDDWNNQISYEFTSLNKIKPQMIEEATKNAREAADKFAKDSESELGKIKSATQGLFTIENRDQYTPEIKKVRVVTSVNYSLED